MSIILLKNINKKFGNHQIFNNFDLEIDEGEFITIMGSSGKGKTTLLNMIGMIEPFNSGEMMICGQKNPKFSSSAARKLRAKKIAYLFQNYGLIDNDTVEENLSVSAKFKNISKKEKKDLYSKALEKVGLKGYEKRKIFTLSGGEQQRVALAKIIVKDPEIILADEPTGSLDAKNRDYVMQILKDLNKENKTIIVVTHDPVVESYAKRKIYL
ncbi:MAG: ABC transporter ATP-binding protein [Clostridia bacterium]|nr:ABC transporter ATP-binding protein [Clostridia bacterium]